MIGVAVAGYGYWGPNLVRNLHETPGVRLVAVCDLKKDRLTTVQGRYPSVAITDDFDEILRDPKVDAVAIATPVSTHFRLAMMALCAGKHVFVEKPMAASAQEALRLVDEAARRRLVLAVDHTFVHTGAVRKIRELVQDELGETYYYDSVRVNLGLFQHDVNVIWDLAVHDLSIMDYVLPERPIAVSATGMSHVAGEPENIAYLNLFYPGNLIAHLHVNWLAPVKVRRTLIGGSRKMIVYDDLEPSEKVKVYDKGITLNGNPQKNGEKVYQMLVGYRTGDMWAPQLDMTEALAIELREFAACVENGTAPIADGQAGLRVVSVLEAASHSLAQRGRPVELDPHKARRMIPFLDLKAQYASIKGELDAAVLGVLASSHYVLGEEVAAFEHEFAEYCQVKHAIAVNTGTSALHLALLAAGIGPGDEVITVPFTFVATASAICYTGARPVFVDVEPVTLTMDPRKLEAAITSRTKAIMPVHLYGQMADMDAILEIAERHGLPVIEDACQAHGAEYNGQRAGRMGVSGCFSFYPGKNLGACGEGGIVVTNDDQQMKTIRMLRDWGQEQRYHHVVKGFNYRMDGIQGAVLRVKLRYLEDWTEARRQRARHYSALLGGWSHIRTPTEVPGRRHVYHIYAIRARDRDDLQRTLQAQGVQTGLHYPIPVHLQKAHLDLGYRAGDFPVSEAAAREVLSLPMFPEMTARQVEQVAAAVEQEIYVG